MNHPDLHVDGHDHAKVDRVDAEPLRDRQEQRRQDQHDGARLHELPRREQRDIHGHEEHPRREVLRGHPLRDRLRNLLRREQVGEQHCVRHDVEQHRARVRRRQQHPEGVADAQVAIDEHRRDERIDGTHGRRLGRREDAAVDPAHHDRDEQEPPEGFAEARPDLAGRRAGQRRKAPPLRRDERHAHQHQRQQDPRDHARDEQLPRTRARADGVDDHHDRRRDQDPERPGRRDHADGEALRIASLHHRRQHDRADRRDGRGARPGDRREERARQDRRHRESAGHPADERRREPDDPGGDATFRQERPREDEERDRHDREALEPREQALRDDVDGLHRERREAREEREHRESERDRDRRAGREQCQQDRDDDERGHACASTLVPGVACTGSAPVRTNRASTCRNR